MALILCVCVCECKREFAVNYIVTEEEEKKNREERESACKSPSSAGVLRQRSGNIVPCPSCLTLLPRHGTDAGLSTTLLMIRICWIEALARRSRRVPRRREARRGKQWPRRESRSIAPSTGQ